jgi:hypothetical protein
MTMCSSPLNKAAAMRFFIDPVAFPHGFSDGLHGEAFRENEGDLNGATRAFRDADGDYVLPRRDWRAQYNLISKLPLVEIT